MPRLSIVIPVLGNLKRLEDTLVSVLANRPADCQIVVVLNQPYEDPYDLKDEVDFVQAPAKAGWAASLQAGIKASRAAVVHLLSCGVEVAPDWADAALPHFQDMEIAAVAAVVLDRADPQRVLSAGVTYRVCGAIRRITTAVIAASSLEAKNIVFSGPDTLAGFYRKSCLEASEGFLGTSDPCAAGVELASSLKRAGFRWALEPKCQACADRALVAAGGSLRKGRDAERLFWRWAPLAGWLRSLAAHAGLLLSETLLCAVRPGNVWRLAGRLLGGLQIASHRPHWQSLREPQPAARPQTLRGPHFAQWASTRCSASASSISSSPSSSSSACSNGPAAPRRLPG